MSAHLNSYPINVLENRLANLKDKNLFLSIVGGLCKKVPISPSEGSKCTRVFCSECLSQYIASSKEKVSDTQMEVKKSASKGDVFYTSKDSACPFKCEPAKFTNAKSKVDNILQRIFAMCKNYDGGGTKFFTLYDLSKHEPKCQYSLVQGVLCEEYIMLSLMKDHQTRGQKRMQDKFCCK